MLPTSSRSLAALPPTVYRTKQELVYRTLARRHPDLRAGARSSAWSSTTSRGDLNVSTIPVREALQMLQSEGLVTMVPHVGAAVASLSRESVVDVFSVLEGLQVVAGRIAATEASRRGAERAVSAWCARWMRRSRAAVYERVGRPEHAVPRPDWRDSWPRRCCARATSRRWIAGTASGGSSTTASSRIAWPMRSVNTTSSWPRSRRTMPPA